jgi:hypothetical protein
MKKLLVLILVVFIGVVIYWKLKTPSAPVETTKREEIALLKKSDELFVRHIDEGPKEINTLQDKANQKSLHEGVAAWVGVYRLELAANPVAKNRKVFLGLYINNSIGQQLSPKRTTLYIQPAAEDGTVGPNVKPLRPLGDGLFVTIDNYPAKMPQKYLVTGELDGKKFSLTFNITNFRQHKILPNEN